MADDQSLPSAAEGAPSEHAASAPRPHRNSLTEDGARGHQGQRRASRPSPNTSGDGASSPPLPGAETTTATEPFLGDELARLHEHIHQFERNVRHRHELLMRDLCSREEELLRREQRAEDLLRQLEERERAMARHAEAARAKIRLNIGGQVFVTSKETLTNERDSFFDAMLRSGRFQPDEEGEYFVDRNPRLFAHLLDYLRTRRSPDPTLLADPDFIDDLRFYQIGSLLEQLSPTAAQANQRRHEANGGGGGGDGSPDRSGTALLWEGALCTPDFRSTVERSLRAVRQADAHELYVELTKYYQDHLVVVTGDEDTRMWGSSMSGFEAVEYAHRGKFVYVLRRKRR